MGMVIEGYVAEELISIETIVSLKETYRKMLFMKVDVDEDVKSNMRNYIAHTNEPYWQGTWAKTDLGEIETLVENHKRNFPEKTFRIARANITIDAYGKWVSYEVIDEYLYANV